MDADTLTRNDLIGSYTVDASYVYFKKDHEQVDRRPKTTPLTPNEPSRRVRSSRGGAAGVRHGDATSGGLACDL